LKGLKRDKGTGVQQGEIKILDEIRTIPKGKERWLNRVSARERRH